MPRRSSAFATAEACSVFLPGQRPPPPPELTPAQASEWVKVVDHLPASHLTAEMFPLLVSCAARSSTPTSWRPGWMRIRSDRSASTSSTFTRAINTRRALCLSAKVDCEPFRETQAFAASEISAEVWHREQGRARARCRDQNAAQAAVGPLRPADDRDDATTSPASSPEGAMPSCPSTITWTSSTGIACRSLLLTVTNSAPRSWLASKMSPSSARVPFRGCAASSRPPIGPAPSDWVAGIRWSGEVAPARRKGGGVRPANSGSDRAAGAGGAEWKPRG